MQNAVARLKSKRLQKRLTVMKEAQRVLERLEELRQVH